MVIEPINHTPELYTVEEFAAAIHVTSQHVYRLCKAKLQPFVTDVNGQKYIKSDALNLFNVGENIVDTNDNKNDNMIQRELIDALQAEIELLRDQLQIKDQQILAASDRLHESHAITMKLTERQQQLYSTAIADAEEMERNPEPDKPQSVEEKPVKKPGFFARIFGKK